MRTATAVKTSRRQFRQTELTNLINLAMSELARFGMAYRSDGAQEDWITSRVSPSKISRKARNLLEIYTIEGAAPRMTEWIKELAGDEYISYRNARRDHMKNEAPTLLGVGTKSRGGVTTAQEGH
jgi:hypothetical protein